MALCFPQRSYAFWDLLLTMVALETRPQIARGCHTEGATLLLTPSHILSTLLFLSFIVSGSAFSKPKFSSGKNFSCYIPWGNHEMEASLALSTSKCLFLYFALCLQVFERSFCHLSTYRLIWFLAAVMLCRAQGKDTPFPCMESRRLLFLLCWFICLHEL